MGAPRTLAELVPRAAATAPASVALVGHDTELTWQQVDAHTQALAATLVASGVGPGDRVAVTRPKGPESFEAVHGILRAGAVMVPIDPSAPAALAREVLRDAGIRAVVGDRSTIRAIDPWTAVDHDLAVVVATDAADDGRMLDWPVATDSAPTFELAPVDEEATAYVIYTSGSTGRPKGIVHTHRSAMAYATRAVAEYRLVPADRLAGMNPLHFDMSTLELYAAPLACATTVVMSETDLQFPAMLTQRSAEHGVTMWYTVPFLLRGVADRGGLDRHRLPALRSILYGGEPYPGASLRRLMEALPGVAVVNVYGPAEVNACTHHHVDDPADVGDDVPIGRPWAGAEVRVVDDANAEVDPGEPGELLVSTPTVMSRYWGLDELTGARLHRRDDGPDWYATGDLVVQDAEGVLWFRGRRDHQVKVRGVRLELEAIEAVLTDAPGVLHAVAGPVGPPGDATHIAATVVPEAGGEIDVAALRRWCRNHLPSVAVPRDIIIRTVFPTTPSGKIDRTAVRITLSADNANHAT